MSERITRSPTFQARQDLHRIDRAPSELHLRARRSAAVRIHFEETDNALLLAESGPADIEHLVEPLELDRAVDAEVRHGAFRSVSGSATSTVRVPF